MAIVRNRSIRSLTTIVAALVLLASGCGDDSSTDTVTDPGSTTTAPSSTTTPDSTTTTAAASTPATPLPDDQLPGEAFDLAPAADAVLAVVGVAFDDTLNVRRAPGTDQDVVAELDPLAADAIASGRSRMLSESIWWELTTVDGIIGWVNARFTAQVGGTDDITARIIEQIGSTPSAESMDALAEKVTGALRDTDIPSTVTNVVPATTGDLGEVTYDLVGLGDDSVHGLRLHVFGTPIDDGGFSLKTVESTSLCDSRRGVSAEGDLCN